MHVFSGEIPFGHAVHTFPVAENTPAISLTGTTLRTGHLYCYLYDSRQQLRASVMLQKPEKVLTVCADWASVGALPGELPAGEWQLHIYNVIGESRSPQPMSYRLDISFDALASPSILKNKTCWARTTGSFLTISARSATAPAGTAATSTAIQRCPTGITRYLRRWRLWPRRGWISSS